jgi:hypothetical protein
MTTDYKQDTRLLCVRDFLISGELGTAYSLLGEILGKNPTQVQNKDRCPHGIRFPHECMECKNEVTREEVKLLDTVAYALLPHLSRHQSALKIASAVVDAIREATKPQEQLRFKSACEIDGPKHPEYVRGYETAMQGIVKSHKLTEPVPVDEGRLWSIVRQAMLRANTLYQTNGGYEIYSAMLDAEAANFAQQIANLYAGHPPAQPAPIPTGRTHELKTDPVVFDAVLSRRKTFEIRYNDRDYHPGDTLILRRTRYTGDEMMSGEPLIYVGNPLPVTVTYVMHGPAYGLAPGWVIMGIARAQPAPVPTSEREAAAQHIRDAIIDSPLHGVSDITEVLAVIDNYIAGLTRPAAPGVES